MQLIWCSDLLLIWRLISSTKKRKKYKNMCIFLWLSSWPTKATILNYLNSKKNSLKPRKVRLLIGWSSTLRVQWAYLNPKIQRLTFKESFNYWQEKQQAKTTSAFLKFQHFLSVQNGSRNFSAQKWFILDLSIIKFFWNRLNFLFLRRISHITIIKSNQMSDKMKTLESSLTKLGTCSWKTMVELRFEDTLLDKKEQQFKYGTLGQIFGLSNNAQFSQKYSF